MFPKKLYEQYNSSIYQHVTAQCLLEDNHLNKCSVCIFRRKQQEMVTLAMTSEHALYTAWSQWWRVNLDGECLK